MPHRMPNFFFATNICMSLMLSCSPAFVDCNFDDKKVLAMSGDGSMHLCVCIIFKITWVFCETKSEVSPTCFTHFQTPARGWMHAPPERHPSKASPRSYQTLGLRNLPPYTSSLVRRENVLHSLTLINDFPPESLAEENPKQVGQRSGWGVGGGWKMHSWQENCCCSLNREPRTENSAREKMKLGIRWIGKCLKLSENNKEINSDYLFTK